MYYSNEIIDEVRSANDIVDVVSSYVKIQKKVQIIWGFDHYMQRNLLHFQYHPVNSFFIVSVAG